MGGGLIGEREAGLRLHSAAKLLYKMCQFSKTINNNIFVSPSILGK
jgi:hypothetical protein